MTHNSERNLEIDFVKGLLVVTMVVYHTFINFYADYEIVRTLTKYVSGGFIYISGILIGFYYLQKYSDDYARIRKRLFMRGLKIFLIFLLANIALFKSSSNISEVLSAYLFYGSEKSRFEILLPISYLLFIAAILVPYIEEYYKYINLLVLGFLCLITLGIVTKTLNLSFLLIRVFGVGNSLLISKIRNSFGLQALCLVLVPVIGWLGLKYSFSSNMMLYQAYIIVVLMTFYNIAKRLTLTLPKNFHLRGGSKRILLNQWVLLFGRYLLFSYVFHLFIIVTLTQIIQRKVSFLQNMLIVILVSTILLVSLLIMDNLRKKITFIDKGYKLIFA